MAAEGMWDGLAEVVAGGGFGVILELLEGALGKGLAAVLAGSGAEVDDGVGRPHGVFVVFYNEEGVAFVAEVEHGLDEALVVLDVEADGGFVEDVEDAGEVGAELGGEANALGFAAG